MTAKCDDVNAANYKYRHFNKTYDGLVLLEAYLLMYGGINQVLCRCMPRCCHAS